MSQPEAKATQGQAASDQHAAIGVAGSEPADVPKHTQHTDAQWFGTAALGLFVHWGISSVHGGIDLSWGMMANTPWDAGQQNRNKITPEAYFGLAEDFQPDTYDPERWLQMAADAGFRYAVMTTRHHDGYALWPSEHGEFGTRTHMHGRDLVQPYVDACRRCGLKVGVYYSPPDWYYNRQYMSFHYGSGQQERFPGREHYGLQHTPVSLPDKPAGWDERYHDYIRGQVGELLTRYGQIDLLWFDGGPAVITQDDLRQLQPGIVINPRMHGSGDFKTPECRIPDEPIDGWWELCDIWNHGGWGYHRPGEYKPTQWMISRFAHVRSWGGNLLINCAPQPDGDMPARYYERMAEFAEWMKHSGESVLDAQAGPYPSGCDVPVTQRGETWYLHVSPAEEQATMRKITAVRSVRLLRTGQPIPYSQTPDGLKISIPSQMRTELDDVVEVCL